MSFGKTVVAALLVAIGTVAGSAQAPQAPEERPRRQSRRRAAGRSQRPGRLRTVVRGVPR